MEMHTKHSLEQNIHCSEVFVLNLWIKTSSNESCVQMQTYNITSGGATGTQLHCTLEEYVIAVVELEHVQVHVVTFDERNTGVNAIEICAQNVRILTAAVMNVVWLVN